MANGKDVGAEHKFSHCFFADRRFGMIMRVRARNYAIGNASPKKQRDRVKIY